MSNANSNKAIFHLPGLFEFYEFYKVFLPLFYVHRDFFYDNVEIGSIYGSPSDCIWGGGRVGFGEAKPKDVKKLMDDFNISPRLTFSNSLLKDEHLLDNKCNSLCNLFSESKAQTGIIICSDLLLEFLKEHYPSFYFISSTTKVQTNFADFKKELERRDFRYVVPDFRLNPKLKELESLSSRDKNKVEFLCNEACSFDCNSRFQCYETVSRKNLGESCPEQHCTSPYASQGYKFSIAMKNPGFIGIKEINNIYLPMGFSNFKIEGRSLGSAIVLEFLLYYLTKPEHQLEVREELYLDSSLDLF